MTARRASTFCLRTAEFFAIYSAVACSCSARLIAAAPELLQALREISNVLNLALPKFELNDESSDDEDSYDDVVSVLARAEAAIDKAMPL